MRRAIRASLSPFATLRSTRGVRSRRIVNADILPSIESMAAANHEPRADGIPQRQHESGVSTIGISARSLVRLAYPSARPVPLLAPEEAAAAWHLKFARSSRRCSWLLGKQLADRCALDPRPRHLTGISFCRMSLRYIATRERAVSGVIQDTHHPRDSFYWSFCQLYSNRV